ncbi:MAG: hypothetical protein DKM50_00520 [Candidatus Margulisiibacteriota bacterium]|nr:MAG: hypothetical protein DKM50_00520 [Candidatus Margulisiibacteriota bacterium]
MEQEGSFLELKRDPGLTKKKKEEALMADIPINLGKLSSVIDETSSCYKDIDEIIDSVYEAGIAKKVARLVPIGVIKGK